MCGCNKQKEWFFTVAGKEYSFNTHAKAVAERRKLAQTNPAVKGVPLSMRTVDAAA